jgi:hypothetical protein
VTAERRSWPVIDLRKPLEGVPGLLLLAALVLFGATIGVSLALVFSWVEMKDSLANFLGGVLGAGLGAALAVLGSVYIQRRDRRDRLMAPANELLRALEDIRGLIALLTATIHGGWLGRGGATVLPLLEKLRQAYLTIPDASQLRRPITTKIEREQSRAHHLRWQIERDFTGKPIVESELDPEEVRRTRIVLALDTLKTPMDELIAELENERY